MQKKLILHAAVLSTTTLVFAATSVLAAPATTATTVAADKTTNKTAKKKATKGKTTAKPATAMIAPVAAPYTPSPTILINQRAQKIVGDLMSRPVRPVNQAALSTAPVEASASKTAWLNAVYNSNMVEASWATEMLSDKRLFAEVLKRELGDKASQYYPKTLGLREFLQSKGMVDEKGQITASGEQIEEALSAEFPAGFLVRPAVGVAPQETAKGLYADTDQFIVDLLKPKNALYSPAQMNTPVRSHILEAVASGEAVVLQENLVMAADAKKPLKGRYFQEVRIHTYEDRVIEDAVPARWVQTNLLTKDQIHAAETYVDGFLKNFPLAFLNRQAWGIDVAVMDNGDMRIVDVVTNRGKAIAWSSYLDQPRIIGAYSRHFEEFYGLHFAGVNGMLIRHGLANYMPFWGKRIENAKPGLGKMTAFLPPVP